MFACACMVLILAAGSSVIRECIELNGTYYNGVKQISFSGQSCLNWLDMSIKYNMSIDLNADPGEWDHSYCRNPDVSDKPWCFVTKEKEGIEREHCILETCQAQTKPPNDHPPLRDASALELELLLSRSPNLRPKNKNDPGALGYTLAAFLMLIIIVLGAGIPVIYLYKKSLKLKMHQEQRAREQEMRRINLLQSAFCNAACDLADESRGQTDKEETFGKHTTTDETEDNNAIEKDG